MHKPRKRELSMLPRTDNLAVKNQGLSFLFIPHGHDEIYFSGIFP